MQGGQALDVEMECRVFRVFSMIWRPGEALHGPVLYYILLNLTLAHQNLDLPSHKEGSLPDPVCRCELGTQLANDSGGSSGRLWERFPC